MLQRRLRPRWRNEGQQLPWFSAAGDGQFQRNVTDGWMSIWDLAKPDEPFGDYRTGS